MSITNPEAVAFSNEKARVAADRLAQTYYFCKEVLDEWYANDMGTTIPVDGGTVVDGSETDGRHPVTGNDVTNVIVRCQDLVTDLEANSKAKLNTILAVAVHTV